MKEWCLKHPYLTFLIVDNLICTFGNLIDGKRMHIPVIFRVKDKVEEQIEEHRDRKEKSEKQPIGFVKR